VDDGISGVTFERKGFQEMLALIEAGEVDRVIVKDLSRLGRNFIEVGQYTDYIFPERDIHFIAIMDNVDSSVQNGTGDFIAPIRNIFNELYISDVSRKLRASQKIKSGQGYPIGKPPLGYMRDPANPKRWAVDEEAAEIIQRIYRLRLEGNSVEGIAAILRRDKVDLPSVYAIKKGYACPNNRLNREECWWKPNEISLILKNQSYCGDVVNFKTFSKSYKLKKRIRNDPENWEIHLDVHEAMVDRHDWEMVQKSFETKYRKPKHTEKSIFAGYLKCSDCGANMRYKYTHPNPDNHYFSCGKYRESLCATTHHIRVDVLEKLTLAAIDNAVRFARDFEDE
jgi:DNA invertase Pin-like site-specific DNA recombinase